MSTYRKRHSQGACDMSRTWIPKEYLLQGSRLVFISFLTISFLYWMAWPSLSHFINGGVLVETSKVRRTSLPAPAVTLCPTIQGNPWLNVSWR